ncbi:MAG TPA: hypothetical protein VGN87_07840, partial [Paenibacillus sp.]
LMLQVELGKLKNSGPGQLDRKTAIAEILKYKLNAVAVLNELADGLPPGSLLRDINYTYRTSIDLTVNVLTMADASNYLRQLRQMSFTVDASIQKLTEGTVDQSAGTTDAATSLNMYTAIYKVNLLANNQQTNGTDASPEEVNSDGTVQ